MKKGLIILGRILIVIGSLLILNSASGITGFAIAEDINKTAGSVIGIVLVAGGVLILAKREQKEGKLIVLVSKKAIERAKNDDWVRGNLKNYIREINLIKSDISHRPQEIIGEFHVSPRSKTAGGNRVAWHYDRATNTLKIDDFLYHINDRDYVDRWNRRASRREITKKTYEAAGYEAFIGTI